MSAELREDCFLQNPQSLFPFSVKFIPNWLSHAFKVCFQVESLKDIYQPSLGSLRRPHDVVPSHAGALPEPEKRTLKCKISVPLKQKSLHSALANLFDRGVCEEADWCCLISADQRVLHQGAEKTLSGLQQHRRLHLHVERHHDYGKMEKSFCRF